MIVPTEEVQLLQREVKKTPQNSLDSDCISAFNGKIKSSFLWTTEIRKKYWHTFLVNECIFSPRNAKLGSCRKEEYNLGREIVGTVKVEYIKVMCHLRREYSRCHWVHFWWTQQEGNSQLTIPSIYLIEA